MAEFILLSCMTAMVLWSVRTTRSLVTPSATFAALWFLGMALHFLFYSDFALADRFYPHLFAACTAVFVGEQCALLIMRQPPSCKATPMPRGPLWMKRLYVASVVLACCGTAWKLKTSVDFFGGAQSLAVNIGRTRSFFGPRGLNMDSAATLLASFMYVAAALSGCSADSRRRMLYFSHLAPALVDSVALAGRGSFVVTLCFTTVSRYFYRNRATGRDFARLAALTLATLLALQLMTIAFDRLTGFSMLKYASGPIYGLNALLTDESVFCSPGCLSVNALTRNVGIGQTYNPGAYIFVGPFVSNVSSGFQELHCDLGAFWWLALLVVSFLAHAFRLGYLRCRRVSLATLSIVFHTYLAFFYFVSLSSFLAGWWLVLFTGIVSFLVEGIVLRRAGALTPQSIDVTYDRREPGALPGAVPPVFASLRHDALEDR